MFILEFNGTDLGPYTKLLNKTLFTSPNRLIGTSLEGLSQQDLAKIQVTFTCMTKFKTKRDFVFLSPLNPLDSYFCCAQIEFAVGKPPQEWIDDIAPFVEGIELHRDGTVIAWTLRATQYEELWPCETVYGVKLNKPQVLFPNDFWKGGFVITLVSETLLFDEIADIRPFLQSMGAENIKFEDGYIELTSPNDGKDLFDDVNIETMKQCSWILRIERTGLMRCC